MNGGGAQPATERCGGRVRVTGVPGEGPVNTSRGGAHEHQQATGKRFVYLDGPEIKWRKLSTTRSSSGGSGERRLRVRAIPAEGSWWLGWVKSRSWGRGWGSSWSSEFGRGGAIGENPGEEQRRQLGVARRKKGQCSWRERKCGRVCSSTWFAEEKEKERERDGHDCAQDGGQRGGGR
jgi:hypothetical protein